MMGPGVMPSAVVGLGMMGSGRGRPIVCYKCGISGHIAKNCYRV